MSDRPPFAALEQAEAEAWFEIQTHVGQAFRDRVDLRVERVAGAVTVMAVKEDMASLNRAWLPGTEPTVTPSALTEILGYARALGKKRFMAHCPKWAATPELMVEHGFRERSSMAQLARRPTTAVPKSAFEIREVAGEDAELFGRVAAESNDLPLWMSDALNAGIGLRGWKHYLVFDGQTPIAAAGLRVHNGFAWCCFAGTLIEHRGRGAQSALLERRIHDAAVAGCEWIVAEAMVDSVSLRNQLRAGFEVAYERPNYVADLS